MVVLVDLNSWMNVKLLKTVKTIIFSGRLMNNLNLIRYVAMIDLWLNLWGYLIGIKYTDQRVMVPLIFLVVLVLNIWMNMKLLKTVSIRFNLFICRSVSIEFLFQVAWEKKLNLIGFVVMNELWLSTWLFDLHKNSDNRVLV